MKISKFALSWALALLFAGLGVIECQAQIWDGDTPEPFTTTYAWTNGSNWDGGFDPDASSTATFSTLLGGNMHKSQLSTGVLRAPSISTAPPLPTRS